MDCAQKTTPTGDLQTSGIADLGCYAEIVTGYSREQFLLYFFRTMYVKTVM